MKVVFLCGGVGKRMSPLSEDKFLLKFLGKTLLQHQIEQAKEAGLTELVLVGNPNNIDKIRSVARTISGIDPAFAIQLLKRLRVSRSLGLGRKRRPTPLPPPPDTFKPTLPAPEFTVPQSQTLQKQEPEG